MVIQGTMCSMGDVIPFPTPIWVLLDDDGDIVGDGMATFEGRKKEALEAVMSTYYSEPHGPPFPKEKPEDYLKRVGWRLERLLDVHDMGEEEEESG